MVKQTVNPNPDTTELSGWKEIAAYLDVDVRTAQRWEEERGLPVTRTIGPRGRVVAEREALDRWKKESTAPKPLWSRVGFLRWYAIVVTGLLLACVGALSRGWIEGLVNRDPSYVRIEGSDIIVTGSRGRELWRYRFPKPFYPNAESGARELFRLADINGDGRTEVLVTYAPADWLAFGHTLYCFSRGGDLLWTYRPRKRVSDADRDYEPSYTVKYDVLAGSGEPGRPKIAVSGVHTWGYPAFIAVLDSGGRELGSYYHSGHLGQMLVADVDGDGREEIVAAGTDNGRQAASLVVLDPANLRGVNAEPPGARFQLRPAEPAAERAVAIFPRTCVGREEEYGRVDHVSFNGQTLDVIVVDSVEGGATGYLIYSLDRRLNLRALSVSDTMRSYHRRLRGDHPLESDLPALRRIEYLKRY